jgi:diguanylate cyclase (GGDEF)-like protein
MATAARQGLARRYGNRVRREVMRLRAALDNVEEGVVLLDAQLNTLLMNRAVRELWGVPEARVARRPPYAELVDDALVASAYGRPTDEREAFNFRRIVLVEAGDRRPLDLRLHDGRVVRSRCTVLPEGGRMLTYTDITDLVRNAEELERLATTDSMTGICNRRRFLELGEAEWGRFQRYHRQLSLLVFDIDRFKSINDGYGHDVGDQAIGHVCRLCTENKRAPDTFGRIGGDEFAVLLPETDAEQAAVVAERLRRTVQDTPFAVDDAVLPLTVSIGAAQAALSQSCFDALMKLADQALYRAKAGGRNQVVFAPGTTGPEYKSAAE